ncbi:MAG TPA: 30S ribosomal protein S9 [Chloroflexi bacterium]|jgi:small subunit ribosomal protein S9|nr:30S ribosomal protein S9 [Chloroflexota bacterium]HPO59631.1 30S ribosomal protein S9 [Anaerolineaceae bacterium]
MSVQYYEGVGRRKESTARVRLMSGSGLFVVNQKAVDAYFTREGDTKAVLAPFEATGLDPKSFDVTVVVKGGGVTGQTDSVQLGLARAMAKLNPELIPALRKFGLLTRDPRVKERKKPGLKRARKAPTYTKR